MLQQFGADSLVVALPQALIGACFEQLAAHSVDYAVVPFENSTNGQVVFTYDLLRDWYMGDTEPPFRIVAEQFVAIHHYLLSNAEDLGAVSRLYSHPQVWGQVTQFLALGKLQNVTRVDTSSTAKAAETVFNDASNTSACICLKMSADLYKLPVKYAEIEDLKNNTTRFLVLGLTPVERRPDEKMITLLMYMLNHNDPGALCSALQAFLTNSVNLTSISSRPSHVSQWQYVFFVEAEGDAEDVAVKQSLAELAKSCTKVAVLGLFARSWRFSQ